MTLEPVKISDAEWEVMRVLWTLNAATAHEIAEILADKMDWKLATVKTLLGRLSKKEVIYSEADGKKFIYYPKVSETETVRSATENLFSHICAKKIGSTIADLIDDAQLTAQDITAIQAALAAKTPVASIACNCIPGQCECGTHQVKKQMKK
ncbi:CopY/TcrY family copper transport repressor [Enterococcus dispar]|uniref:CopY/TcrY family copper transport repressor n=1 Tax=Enterococcus dispar ATCC 51266 TaxID=1139219 RepID=S0KRU1_9ENTE|nr:CopY/TcrY family copper transport repressor [Enterococcus dispar]EOT43730.1 CopY/TcrY family copper transport repressor [Enterococcus dispar ATCC 51266]EOW85598.1 CopY/TcrY family copper transport repressor [Enterococcus dispar ATCC 51266]OJG37737.1 CopY/TcrY family copper transport repressor [Enterococcus dispar]